MKRYFWPTVILIALFTTSCQTQAWLEREKEAIIAEMEETGNSILPDQNACTLARRKNRDASGLFITLRHGRPGINHAVQYFTMNSTSLRGTSHDHLSYRALPRQINTLFRELRNSYDHETPRTRESVHAFLNELKTAYSPRPVRPNLSRQTIPQCFPGLGNYSGKCLFNNRGTRNCRSFSA